MNLRGDIIGGRNEKGADFKTSTEKNGEAAPHMPVRGRAQGSNTENASPCKILQSSTRNITLYVMLVKGGLHTCLMLGHEHNYVRKYR